MLEWFWTIISGFTHEEMARLLQFTTGCSQLPPGGFCELCPKFQITASLMFDGLPTAHTWCVILLVYVQQSLFSPRSHVFMFYCRSRSVYAYDTFNPLRLAYVYILLFTFSPMCVYIHDMPMFSVFCHLSCPLVSYHILVRQVLPSQVWSDVYIGMCTHAHTHAHIHTHTNVFGSRLSMSVAASINCVFHFTSRWKRCTKQC